MQQSSARAAKVVIIGGCFAVLFALIVFLAFHAGPPTSRLKMDYADVIGIVLSAVTVVLAVLAIGIGLLTLYGYREFIAKAEQTAATTAATVATFEAKKLVAEKFKEYWDANKAGTFSVAPDAVVLNTTLAPDERRDGEDGDPDIPRKPS